MHSQLSIALLMYLTNSDDNSCISMCLYFLMGTWFDRFDKDISITKLAFHTNSIPIEDGTNILTTIKWHDYEEIN